MQNSNRNRNKWWPQIVVTATCNFTKCKFSVKSNHVTQLSKKGLSLIERDLSIFLRVCVFVSYYMVHWFYHFDTVQRYVNLSSKSTKGSTTYYNCSTQSDGTLRDLADQIHKSKYFITTLLEKSRPSKLHYQNFINLHSYDLSISTNNISFHNFSICNKQNSQCKTNSH